MWIRINPWRGNSGSAPARTADMGEISLEAGHDRVAMEIDETIVGWRPTGSVPDG